MKKILLFLSISVALFACCGPQEKKIYNFEVIHTNGDTIKVSYLGFGTNLFSLKNGDLTTHRFEKTLLSGVRSFRVISITNLGLQTEEEMRTQDCCNLVEIKNEE